ncbi:hypothetical protein RBA41_08260 [Massilia sp. CCM 9210]|uniref:hypothetical protein n=1 Tax=Massilia scottii TaxID=3057166 RepID=UPI002796471E|nr:hypothetical protein [Massilia sp. CCM 9210]MDQ1813294.1 hypothetical protein [Massilia sp. CCM 9210]
MTSIFSESRKALDDFEALFSDHFEMKRISASNGDFGELEGIQFDSAKRGGFLYFWSTGMIEYHLVDYEKGEEIIPVAARVVEKKDIEQEYLGVLINAIRAEIEGGRE